MGKRFQVAWFYYGIDPPADPYQVVGNATEIRGMTALVKRALIYTQPEKGIKKLVIKEI